MKPRTEPWLLALLLIMFSLFSGAKSKCGDPQSCEAWASFYVWKGSNLTLIGNLFDTTPENIDLLNDNVPNKDSVESDIRININFSCGCLRGEFLGHVFDYDVVQGDTYERVVTNYSGLTTVAALTAYNGYDPNNIPNTGKLNVTVDCMCGDRAVSDKYGFFTTYPIQSGDSLGNIASTYNISTDLLQRYNPGANFSNASEIVFVPTKDRNGSYRPLSSSSGGLGGGIIAGIIAGVVAVVLLLAFCIYVKFFRKKVEGKLIPAASEDQSSHRLQATENSSDKVATAPGSAGLAGLTVDKSVEFSYDELAGATDYFSMSYKIGQGGFGAVYYAELRGEKAAIKKMDMQATREFLAELKVLTRVHHLNLVRLIGYCVEGSLFLVYEFIENGNLSQHLRGSEREPLPWSTRVQIALDSARGLEYIHEHTVPVYIHRDIKSANILIDKNFHGKVADFGLTKLTEVGGSSLPTRLVGTFGYMPPEYAQYGDVSPKIDVYAFGVVLYELISAKEAIVKLNGSGAESKGLVGLFEEVLNQPDSMEELTKLVDPRLGDNYPLDSVRKMAQLAKACTHENPQLRPSMRSIVVALMTLSSTTEDWDVASFYENHGLVNLMSGR
ncbi:chitin elicitor receptor kinase 1 [Morus notabilis]|uniref:chitin elicitor receptor kinase 1 n=1 Tax=Morus notabilis TaxID=981085 RepID=UPI000CECFACE|nr:chitin elicitor receptor kinase 1 [Morus notabilis]